MSRIAETPEPPYYAVIAPAVLAADVEGYAAMAAEMLALAPTQPGFLGIEVCMEREFSGGRISAQRAYWDRATWFRQLDIAL